MRLIVDAAHRPVENMARDEALFRAFDGTDTPVWRCYTWDRPAVTYGRLQPCPGDGAGFPVIRRLTGGGLVPHGADLTYCVVQERRRGHENYRDIVEILAETLRSLGIDCAVRDEPEQGNVGRCFASLARFDIHVAGRKLAGCAQYRTRGAIIHQGSVANGAPREELATLDVWAPASAITIEEILGRNLGWAELADAIETTLIAEGTTITRDKLTTDEEEAAVMLRGKYSSDSWNRDAVYEF